MTTDFHSISDHPIAVFVGRDGWQEVRRLYEFPPPRCVYLPRRVPLSLVDQDASKPRPVDHIFRLAPTLRAPSHRWWRVFNDGRSRTPEDGFVYLEERPNE